MPATNSNSPGGLGGGYVDDDDDLRDYDAEIPDIDTTIRAPALPEDNKKDTLGIDEEVKIRKNRIAVKLDEARYVAYVLPISKYLLTYPKTYVKSGNAKIETRSSQKT